MLHTKYRPSNFSEMFGNRGVIKSIESILTRPNCPHTFLLVGTTGVGKTTTARIIARNLGCLPPEIKEINASDSRGIDFARSLNIEARWLPMHGKVKVFILDEVHALTGDAMNALLKILEEPPKHTYFVLCTTAPDKLLPTILTRCARYTLNPLVSRDMEDLINHVCEQEKISLTPEVKEIILDHSEGIPRTALILTGMLDGISDINDALDIAYREIYEINGIPELCKEIIAGNKWTRVLEMYKGLVDIEPEKIRISMLGYFAGCMRTDNLERLRLFTTLTGVFATPLNYISARNELLYRIGDAFLK